MSPLLDYLFMGCFGLAVGVLLERALERLRARRRWDVRRGLESDVARHGDGPHRSLGRYWPFEPPADAGESVDDGVRDRLVPVAVGIVEDTTPTVIPICAICRQRLAIYDPSCDHAPFA